MILTHQGKSLKVPEWSKLTGLSAATIISRKSRGWSDSRALTEPANTSFSKENKVTKSDAEIWLNDCKFPNQVPKFVHKLMPVERFLEVKLGIYIRRYHPKEFDKWFNEEYKPAKQNGSLVPRP